MNDLVKCCNCGWRGLEGELVSFSDDSGGGYGCPNCKTDEYLSDVIGDKMDNFVKITTGWVRQYYEPNKDGIFVCT
ncbi:MAG: hypothetical protein KAW56_15515, partial [Candidatus Marinimicrobia bacterium]|nr:hypothetical protein [Candidatus Neomarinimicrobiota bacterium]